MAFTACGSVPMAHIYGSAEPLPQLGRGASSSHHRVMLVGSHHELVVTISLQPFFSRLTTPFQALTSVSHQQHKC